jgi:RimJ/RimL family protein N-acetyltransferase
LSHVSTIVTDRLLLIPLLIDDAEEMVNVLADPALHEFTGGEPATLVDLRDRYRSWIAGSGRDTERWLNWIVRCRGDGAAIGTVQATVMNPDADPVAFVAWTIGVGWQRQGYATEATAALVEWLVDHGVDAIVAHVHPQHIASANVATRAGLRPTSEVVDGEVVWRLPRPDDQPDDQPNDQSV